MNCYLAFCDMCGHRIPMDTLSIPISIGLDTGHSYQVCVYCARKIYNEIRDEAVEAKEKVKSVMEVFDSECEQMGI